MRDRKDFEFFKWGKCGGYYIESIEGRDYIRPDLNSGFILVDVAQYGRQRSSRRVEENTLVYSLLNLDVGNREAILNFVNQFGFLGLLQHKYLKPMYAPPGTDAGSVHPTIVPERLGYITHRFDSIAKIYLLEPEVYQQKSRFEVIKNMSEPLEDFIEEVQDFQKLGKWIAATNACVKKGRSAPLRGLMKSEERFENVASTADNEDLAERAAFDIAYRLQDKSQGLTRIVVPGEGGTWKIKWGFESLLDAAYYFLSEDMVSHFWIGNCPRCGKHFLSSVGSKEYCSRRCEDAARKAEYRKQKKQFKGET